MNNIEHAYDAAAREFENKFSDYAEYIKQVTKFAELFPKGSSLLDIGCGPGLNAKIFAQKKLSVTGFDISPEMIKLARKNCPSGDFLVSSVEEFSTDVKFDGICLSFIIVHLKTSDAVSLLNRLSRFVKPDGKVYISFMTGRESGYESASFSKNKIFFNYFEKEFIISCLEKNGFRLFSSDTASYEESDGSTTEELFLIFKYNGKAG